MFIVKIRETMYNPANPTFLYKKEVYGVLTAWIVNVLSGFK